METLNTQVNITELEQIVLNVIAKGDEYEDMPSECIENIKYDTNLSTKILRGVLSSLLQKGLLKQGEYPNGMTAFHYCGK
jgi:predicted transcriptional regulator